ncbi:MAG: F0F1 ATP synthase subunit epsilon [Alphaproteobacteria bacterium]|jgi:F-type H+-transporting ATPase subunit epsilon|nr:F0F1 ATP synthase subunit epsilon [Alphaproteobacteria bacterium]
MAAFHFELVSPEKLLFSGSVEQVVVPGTEGEFAVLKDHAPVISTLRAGIVTVSETATKSQRLFVRGGFVDVSDKGLVILAEEAIPVEQFDLAQIDAQIKAAEEDLADARSEESKAAARDKLAQLGEVKRVLGH